MKVGECPTKRGDDEKTPHEGEIPNISPTSIERRRTRSMVKLIYSN